MESPDRSSNGENNTPRIKFHINGLPYEIKPGDKASSPEVLLVDFIREQAGLTGTKAMCRAGGCGVCVVNIRYPSLTKEGVVVKSGNSCLIPVLSCSGWYISTIESLGSHDKGYSEIQREMVEHAGTQCGFCTPGMIMTMTSALKANGNVPTTDIEDLLGGNICRCTGYRPIVDAFKAVVSGSVEPKQQLLSQETCPPTFEYPDVPLVDHSTDDDDDDSLMEEIRRSGQSGMTWASPRTLDGIFSIIRRFRAQDVKYRVIAGNTGTGIYKNEGGHHKGYIDITRVPELKTWSVDYTGVALGSGVTLSHALRIFRDKAGREGKFEGLTYGGAVAKHLGRVANVHVRNIATIGGSLMLKHEHPEFHSDLFVILVTLNAVLTIASSTAKQEVVKVQDFLDYNMSNKILVKVHIPRMEGRQVFYSFKISTRYQNTIADLIAGFLINISEDFVVLEKPNIVYGGIQLDFVHASNTESFLRGKSLKDPAVVAGAMRVLREEIQPESEDPLQTSPKYKKLLTQSLLYKVILKVLGPAVSPMFKTGATELKRGKTSGKQDFDSDPSLWPVNKPINKLEAEAQCSGEAIYVNDIPKQPKELCGAFVLSTVGRAEIQSIDTSRALELKGVVAFIDAQDVPGNNNFMALDPTPEPVFISSGKIFYAGQPVGMILAETQSLACKAAKMVQVEYKNVRKPVLHFKTPTLREDEVGDETIDDDCSEFFEVLEEPVIAVLKGPEAIESDPEKTQQLMKEITGTFITEPQYHFHMENQTCLVVPEEDRFRVYASTQSMDHCQLAVSNVLGIPCNKISIEVQRLGGGFGAKIHRASHIAAACAVGAQVTQRPVRMAMDLQSNMELIGKRRPTKIHYKVRVQNDGRIQHLKASIYSDVGLTTNDPELQASRNFQNCYDVTGWQVFRKLVKSNSPPNTYCRAAGTGQTIAQIEEIMEHIAYELGLDPIEVRKANFIHEGSSYLIPDSSGKAEFQGVNKLFQMIEKLKKSSDYGDRAGAIEAFNKSNRWKKRGISIVPMRYHNDFPKRRIGVYIAIYGDGTVVVSHGGIEMGHGINTKVAQTVAYKLGVGIEKIRVSTSGSLIGANSSSTGGSVTTERTCFAAIKACEILLTRLNAVKQKLNNPSWVELVGACLSTNVDLRATYMGSPDDPIETYDIWGLAVTEVEIDCLTGEHTVVRVDLLEDAGKSRNPKLDIGQVEGAFIMGLGWWTTERLVYHPDTGRLLSTGTEGYKPPTVANIPRDFRVALLKNSSNPAVLLGSKATGEPALCLSVSVFFALKNAIIAARKDVGLHKYPAMSGPLTPEKILKACGTKGQQFVV